MKESFAESVIDRIEDGRLRRIAQRRYQGATLREIGREESVTVERVRQLYQRALRVMRWLQDAPLIPNATTPIKAVSASVRFYNCYSNGNITTLSDLAALTAHEFWLIRNCGPKTVIEGAKVLAKAGLKFQQGDQP